MAERLALKGEAVLADLETLQPVSSTSDASFFGVQAALLAHRSLAEAAHKASLNAKKKRSIAVEPEPEAEAAFENEDGGNGAWQVVSHNSSA